MSDVSFTARMQALGVALPPEEMARLEMLVAELDRSAAAIRAVARGYAEEPSNVFRLAP